MADLLYYGNCRMIFQDDYNRKVLDRRAVRLIIRKLLRHYKLGMNNVQIRFTSGRNYSKGGRHLIIINMDVSSFGLICHEVAHTYQAVKEGFERGDHWHTKRHTILMKRLLNYCKKKNYFEAEINKRYG